MKHIGVYLARELERLRRCEARRRIIERLREGRPYGCGRPPGARP